MLALYIEFLPFSLGLEKADIIILQLIDKI